MNTRTKKAPIEMGRQLARAHNMPREPEEPSDGALTEKPEEALQLHRAPIGKAEVLAAQRVLSEYKASKQAFDMHVVADEDWWRLRHWDILNMRDGESTDDRARGEIDPKSAWAFNSVINKHADFMDSTPTFAALPREAGDEEAAMALSQILPVIYEQNDFEGTYDSVSLAKCKHGTGIYGVFWDGEKLGGLGDISITEVDCLNLFWEGGINHIQKSQNIFYVTEINRSDAQLMYPELREAIAGGSVSGTVEEYRSDDYTDKSLKVEVVDWYYRRGGILHLCKFCAGVVLFSSENMPERYPNGIYKHGKYPFFVDRLYALKGTPGGFGIIDIAKSDQEQIDRLSRSMLSDVLGAPQRTFIGEGAGVNAEDIADPTKRIVKFSGTLDDKSFRTVQPTSNAESYMNIISQKINQLRETTGNNDVVSGNVPAGVTAASAIAALQEQAGKTSRDAIRASYRVHAEIARCVIELIREFYDMPRTFRILGEGGASSYVSFSKANMAPHPVRMLTGETVEIDPIYDIRVSAQKSSPYSAMAQNELAIQFYNAGFFNPANADMAISAIEMMDFKDKDKLIAKISQNGTLYRMVKVLSERLARAEAMLGMRAGAAGTQGIEKATPGKARLPEQNAEGVVTEESGVTKKARARALETTAPR